MKELVVRLVPPSEVQDLIAHRHYLRSMPKAAMACFGVYRGQRLVGAVVLTVGPRNGHRLLAADPCQVLTLARLWLADSIPKNAESRVLGVVLRHVRRDGRWKLVLSYADPAAGHSGAIYRASGWSYLGQAPPEAYVLLGDGTIHHPRSVSSRYGSNSVGHLSRTGVPAVRTTVPGKHRYAYVLDPSWAWRLRIRPRQFPRAPPPRQAPVRRPPVPTQKARRSRSPRPGGGP